MLVFVLLFFLLGGVVDVFMSCVFALLRAGVRQGIFREKEKKRKVENKFLIATPECWNTRKQLTTTDIRGIHYG